MYVQAARANALTAEAGLSDRLSFQVADALHMPFSDGERWTQMQENVMRRDHICRCCGSC